MPQYLSPGVYVEEVPSSVRPIAGVGTSTAAFIGVVPDTVAVPGRNPAYDPTLPPSSTNPPSVDAPVPVTAAASQAVLCTTFTDFTNAFGAFSTDAGQRALAHAVYGFFNNGGSRCYVVRVAAVGDITGTG